MDFHSDGTITAEIIVIFSDIIMPEDEQKMILLGSGERAVYLPKYGETTGSIYWGGFCSHLAKITFDSFKTLKDNIEQEFGDRILCVAEIDF